jgi:hypothetical protein
MTASRERHCSTGPLQHARGSFSRPYVHSAACSRYEDLDQTMPGKRPERRHPMSGWHPPLHPMKHPVSHLVAQSDLELRADGVAHLELAKAQLAGDHASDTTDASGALNAAFEDFQEIQNRNAANWHRGAAVEVAADLAETFYLKGRVAEQAALDRSDLGWADDFYRRAAEQVTPNRSFYQEEWGAFCARAA